MTLLMHAYRGVCIITNLRSTAHTVCQGLMTDIIKIDTQRVIEVMSTRDDPRIGIIIALWKDLRQGVIIPVNQPRQTEEGSIIILRNIVKIMKKIEQTIMQEMMRENENATSL